MKSIKAMRDALLTYLFDKYVWVPAQKKRIEQQRNNMPPSDYFIEIEPSPEWEAQLEKNFKGPTQH